MTNIYKIELFVVDHDDIGADEIRDVLENTRYPSHCISPSVLTIEGKYVGAYDDSRPLNNTDTRQKEVNRLFTKWQPLNTAPRDGTRIFLFYGLANAVLQLGILKSTIIATQVLKMAYHKKLQCTNTTI